MGYKSLLTVITDTDQLPQLQAAIAIARHEEAHLDVFCLSVDRTQSGYYYAGASAYVFQEAIDSAMEQAGKLRDWAQGQLENKGITFSVDAAVAQIGGLSGLIASRARFCDLVILGRPYDSPHRTEAEAITEAALFDGSCPVLIVPCPITDSFAKKVLVAWNQSNEALVATRRALPLLQAAESVEITVVDPSPYSPERAAPGEALAQMLCRQGVKAEIAVLARTLPQISEIINRRATEIGADMVVMGAYGHSRFRQAILGGATRNTLEQTTVPVFMAR